MSTSAALDAVAPGFASDADVETFLTLAASLTSKAKFGDKYELARALRAAHMMAMRDRNNTNSPAGGAITSKREGSLSVGYSVGKNADVDLAQTGFGVQLQGLIRSCVTAVGVTGGALTGGIDVRELYG